MLVTSKGQHVLPLRVMYVSLGTEICHSRSGLPAHLELTLQVYFPLKERRVGEIHLNCRFGHTAALSRLRSGETLDKDTFSKTVEFVYQVCTPNSDIKPVLDLRWFLFKNQSNSDSLPFTKYSIGESILRVYFQRMVSVNDIIENPLIPSLGNCDWKWVAGK